jgi:hypothetical protein
VIFSASKAAGTGEITIMFSWAGAVLMDVADFNCVSISIFEYRRASSHSRTALVVSKIKVIRWIELENGQIL